MYNLNFLMMDYYNTADTISKTNKKNDADIKALFEKSLLKITDEFKEPPVCLTVGHEETESVVCTLGNISLVIGKSKSRKTYFVSAMAAAFLKNGTVIGFRSHLPHNKRKILYVDTEQGRFHCHKVLKRILKAATLPESYQPDNFLYMTLRQHDPTTRSKIVEYAIDHSPEIGVVIIDGIRDLLFSFNDERESIELVTNLMKWSQEKEIHIVSVLHQNKNDDNARGHLGSELTNKAESILTVIKDSSEKDISIVRSNLRDKDFNDVAFGVDEDDTPIIKNDYHKKPEKSKYNDPADHNDQLHRNLLDYVFEKTETFSFNEFAKAIKYNLSRFDISIGDNKTRNWASYYLENEFVENIGSGKEFKIRYVKN